ncbi:MAG: hypothetical protein M3Z75_24890 [Actinomycetota bacterium]|nr:hypothetical protein [Actinomycetota bacterium]
MAAVQAGPFTLLLVQTAASWFMAGLIWTMQILNYPLLAFMDASDVPRYEQAHNRRFSWLVGPGVAVALASTVALISWRPAGVPLAEPLAALALLVVIVSSTVRQGAPSHARLAVRFEADVHARLVHTNWIRTAAWSALGVLALVALALAAATPPSGR